MRLMLAQCVKPYVKTNKSEYIDAEASMRFVPIKLDLWHKTREQPTWHFRTQYDTYYCNSIGMLRLQEATGIFFLDMTSPKG